MSTPTPVPPTASPEFKAASPYLKQGIASLVQAITTIATGGPALETGLRVAPAVDIFIGQITLLAPGLLAAEEGVAATDVIAKLNAVSAKLP